MDFAAFFAWNNVSMITETPFAIVRCRIEFTQRRSAVGYRYQDVFLIGAGYGFWHDAVCAVYDLFDSP